MKIYRVMPEDAEIVNRIANHPDVFPFVSMGLEEGDSFDFRHINSDDYLMFTNGVDIAGLFERSAPFTYEQHTMSLRSAKPISIVRAFLDMHDLMAEMGVVVVWGRTPVANVRARRFNTAMAKVGKCGGSIGIRNDFMLGLVEEFHKTMAPRISNTTDAGSSNSEVI